MGDYTRHHAQGPHEYSPCPGRQTMLRTAVKTHLPNVGVRSIRMPDAGRSMAKIDLNTGHLREVAQDGREKGATRVARRALASYHHIHTPG